MAGEVTYQMTEDDYVAANRLWFMRTVLKPRALNAPLIAAAICFALGFALMRFIDEAPLGAQLWLGLYYALGCLVAFAFLYGLSYLLMPRRARKLFAQQTAMHKPLRFGWSEEGVVQGSSHGEGRYAWSDLHRWSDGASSTLLYHNDTLYFVVPRRALSDEQHRDVVDLLERSGLTRF